MAARGRVRPLLSPRGCAPLRAGAWAGLPPSPWHVYAVAVHRIAYREHRHGIKGR